MTRWRFLDEDIVLAIHEEVLAAHGGAVGIIGAPALAAAIERPRQVARAEPGADAARLAAACALGFLRSHPFVNGKKRVALVAMELFLADNGHALMANDVDCVIQIHLLASREIDDAALADWLRANIAPRGHSTSTS